ncbi:MAG TPA: hypothetical protein PLI94_08185 [Bacillota bacterium]|jgi:hypothetical protein|nr:hypothetical protein [Bacillota bacterium]HPT68002.1 hypothetical protein [Bacillota bacterium]
MGLYLNYPGSTRDTPKNTVDAAFRSRYNPFCLFLILVLLVLCCG